MKREEEYIKEIIGSDAGFVVPDSYFETMREEVMAKLPAYPAPSALRERTRWEKFKPYVYLAAMFAGIWLMMQVFHNVSDRSQLSLDNPPEMVAQAIMSHDFDEFDYDEDTFADLQIESDLEQQYSSIADFEKDFGYSFKPEYQSIDI